MIEEQDLHLRNKMLEKISNTSSHNRDSKIYQVVDKNLTVRLTVNLEMIHLVLMKNTGNGWLPVEVSRYNKDLKQMSKSSIEWMNEIVEQVIVLDAMGEL